MKLLLGLEFKICCKQLIQSLERGEYSIEYINFSGANRIDLLLYKTGRYNHYYENCPFCNKGLEIL